MRTDDTPRRPRPGPQHTVESTRPLAAGAVRRTTSIDTTRPDGPAGPVTIVVGGRDAVRAVDGAERVVDSVRGHIEVDGFASVATADIDGGATPAPSLEGVPILRGWGRALAPLLPPRRTLLASLLEDLGGAFLVSGYAPLRSGHLSMPPEEGRSRAADQEGICIGWAAGGEVVTVLATTGRNAVPIGPAAGEHLLSTGWHGLESPEAHTVRRVRRLDVGPPDAGERAIQAYLRDSYQPVDDDEMVMHEYLVDATVDGAGRITSIEVTPRVLPWESCPGAVASAQQVVGESVDEIADRARRDLRGPSTCTHLSSTIRSLADVAHLATLP